VARTRRRTTVQRTTPSQRAAPASPEFLTLLHAAQLSPTQIARRYGSAAPAVVRAQPYRLVRDIAGLPFQLADTLAQRLGTRHTDAQRVRAGIAEILQRAVRAGHTCFPLTTTVRRAATLLHLPRTVVEEHCLRGALDIGGTFVIERRGTETFFTSLALQRLEERVAQAVADQQRMATPPLLTPVGAVANSVAQRCGLNPEQQQAVVAALSAPLTVVTGGPGTGKSFFCSALAEVAHRHQLPLLAAAPTGRAAQRLTELTGLPAATLHRLLEYQPASGEFLRHADFPLQAALVVVDETSMLDLFLFDTLLAALPLGAKLVLIGDVDQLPSVGPGQVLADLIAAGIAPVVRLTQLYRRTPQSLITVNAHRVRAGQLPLIPSDPQADFRFVEETDPEKAVERVVELVAREIPAETGLDPLTAIQVLCPMNQGAAGTRVLNRALQHRLNPDGRRVPVDPETEFRVGDRVLVTHNNHRLGLFNGESGILLRAHAHKRLALVRTEKEEALLVGEELAALSLGYAVSVHRAQGGEFPVVVVLLHDLHAPLLQRTLLYTALTRAKHLCIIVGTRSALAQAVHNQRSMQRYTGLAAAIHRACPFSASSVN